MKFLSIFVMAILATTSFAAGKIPAPEVTSTHTRPVTLAAGKIPAPEWTSTHTRPSTAGTPVTASTFTTSTRVPVFEKPGGGFPVLDVSEGAPTPHGTAFEGALDEPRVTMLSTPTQGPAQITISVINNAGRDMRLKIDDKSTVNLPAAQATSISRASPFEGGRIAFHEGSNAFMGDESLIEYTYAPQPTVADGRYGIFDINISYVDGFTFPIVCVCPGNENRFLTGCQTNLWNVNTCPSELRRNEACSNPKRSSNSPSEVPHDFFAPCRGQAYTFPWDHDANSNGECQSGTAICTIYPNTPKRSSASD